MGLVGSEVKAWWHLCAEQVMFFGASMSNI